MTRGDGRASLWVGLQPDGSGFTLDYRWDTSSWRFSYVAGETWEELIPWTPRTDTRNLTRLEIRAKGDRLRIVVDGIVVGSVSDPRYRAGLVAFGGGLFTDSQSDEFVVKFDDLRVCVPK